MNIEDNRKFWTLYDWESEGDEWSSTWGGTNFLWWGTVFPRIHPFFPTGHLLEIAPGFGRFTQYLKDCCRHLTLVDLTPKCIEACRQRFTSDSHIDYIVNDGKSLPKIPDSSIDFIFSFDSLVHVNKEVIQGYLNEIGRALKPTGTAFIHHSNLAEYLDAETEKLTIENLHGRDETVSAQIVDQLSREAGLRCLAQEKINWGGDQLTDCLSLLIPDASPWTGKVRRFSNPLFMEEAKKCFQMSELYGFQGDPFSGNFSPHRRPFWGEGPFTDRPGMDMLVHQIPGKDLIKALSLKLAKRIKSL